MKKFNVVLSVLYFGLIFLVFKNWFSPNPLSSGDWLYRFPESIQNPLFPYAWDPFFNATLGGNTIFLLALNTYFVDTARLLFLLFHTDWNVIERIVWFYPYLFLVFTGPFFLAQRLLKNKSLALLSSVIYGMNTYVLMVVSGGQIGIGMAYAIFPLVLLAFLNIFYAVQHGVTPKILLRKSILGSLTLSFLILFDLRIFYVGMIFMVSLFTGLILLDRKNMKYTKFSNLFLFLGIIPCGLTFLFHSFWLVPFLLLKQNPLQQLGDMYTSVGSVKFFSFAFLENSISLLHPNWPENLFGKVYFMRPEFLLIPVVAFSFLLFKKNSYDKLFAVLAILSLCSIFLAKGTNDPFGQVYIFLFLKIPFFQMLRDSTKWFLPIALSYSILIPLSLSLISRKFKMPMSVSIFLFLIVWLFSIRQVFSGEVTGTFKPHVVPAEYQKLEQMISSDTSYFRTLWIPTVSRYAYYDMNHPRVSFNTLFSSSSSAIFQILQNPETEKLLQEESVKYIVIPYDSIGEIYMKDRKYDNSQYEQFLKKTAKISYFSSVPGYGKLGLYEVKGYKPHVFLSNSKGSLQILKSSPTNYVLQLKNIQKGDVLIFSETYDPYWKLGYDDNVINPIKHDLINSYVLVKQGSYQAEIEYAPQKIVSLFTYISIVVFIGAVIILILTFIL